MGSPTSWSFGYIAAAGNLACSSGRCTLHTINVNTKASSAVITVYNNTSAVAGDIIAIIDAATGPNTWVYDVTCGKGLFVVLSGGNADVTVSFG